MEGPGGTRRCWCLMPMGILKGQFIHDVEAPTVLDEVRAMLAASKVATP